MPQFSRILDAYRTFRAADRPLVLATVVATRGSTYRKAGAMMLLDGDGAVAGLLSGGCLEGDLVLRGEEVLSSGRPDILVYDLRPDSERIWGIGAGCEGESTIFLQRLDATNHYGPLPVIEAARARQESLQLATILTQDGSLAASSGMFVWLRASDSGAGPVSDSRAAAAPMDASSPPYSTLIRALQDQPDDYTGSRTLFEGDTTYQAFLHGIPPNPALLILGAGPDVPPVARFAVELGWRVTVLDHRPRYIEDGAGQFPPGVELRLGQAEELAQWNLSEIDAAVIMSHHFDSDVEYLRHLLASSVDYIGLLGPARRREKLLEHTGATAGSERLHSPIGLDLGGTIPEAIALAIVAEIQAFLDGRSGQSLGRPGEAGHVSVP